ncbi:hypothetical protein OHA77_36130 [Streptosporangium sp. NBC_01639]|uniref:hypothetical protein n=1 Tax=Streptosporangium sp. NBC_01639 TaxID=2975948 RepID=UPI003867AB80|nr:hypothetical protein OHA77_36130 [Streptosporangium sp. NBC_01639]
MLRKIVFTATLLAGTALAGLTPASAAAPAVPKGFLLHDREVAKDQTTKDEPADAENVWRASAKAGERFVVDPCANSTVAAAQRKDPKIGQAGRAAARTIYFTAGQEVETAEQVILYRSEQAAQSALHQFQAGVQKCRQSEGWKNGSFNRSLARVALGDGAWKSSARDYQDGKPVAGDDVVIVRRANAVIVYLASGASQPAAKSYTRQLAHARQLLAKVCQIAACAA